MFIAGLNNLAQAKDSQNNSSILKTVAKPMTNKVPCYRLKIKQKILITLNENELR